MMWIQKDFKDKGRSKPVICVKDREDQNPDEGELY